MKERVGSLEYFIHLKRLARIKCGDFSKNISGLEKSKKKSISLTDRTNKVRETCGEYQRRWDIQRENARLAQSIEKCLPVVSFKKNEEQFKKHVKDKLVRSRLCFRSNIREFRVLDIVWKTASRNCRQHFAVQSIDDGTVVKGSIEDISKHNFKLQHSTFHAFRINGETKTGKFMLSQNNIVPILFKRKEVGYVILDFGNH